MSDFRQLVRFMTAAYQVGQAVSRPRVPQSVPAPAHLAFLRFQPNYWTPAGLRTATLDKTEMFGDRPTAYYSMVYRNPITGLRERRAWRYVLKNGVPVEHKAFPVSVR